MVSANKVNISSMRKLQLRLSAHNPLSVSVLGPDLDIPMGLRPLNPCHARDRANNVHSLRTSSAPC